MAKPVNIEITIDEKGVIHVTPNGTQGSECLELMAFLDKIPGLSTTEVVKNDDFKTKKVQIAGQQKIGN